jgi:hypothetical protein
MMLNTSQNLDSWQQFFNTPSGSKLGLMNAIYQIGSLASFPFVYVNESYYSQNKHLITSSL